ncbi:MAG: hypothetical protein BMS9Abin34_150 [Patescibacteria group bacterium]|nr:MAG: hypothetical protein BMS9Abin34_150 [Patescibacteria group bacterium]
MGFLNNTSDKKEKGNSPAKAKDPVCGMEVDPKTAESLEKDGQTYYFCSAKCKEDFSSKSGDSSPKKSGGCC